MENKLMKMFCHTCDLIHNINDSCSELYIAFERHKEVAE